MRTVALSLVLTFAIFVGTACSMAATANQPEPNDYYQKGLSAGQRGDWGEARDRFVAAGQYLDAPQRAQEAAANATTIVTSYDRAVKAMDAGNYRDAVPLLDEVVRLSPDFKDARQRRQEAVQKSGG